MAFSTPQEKVRIDLISKQVQREPGDGIERETRVVRKSPQRPPRENVQSVRRYIADVLPVPLERSGYNGRYGGRRGRRRVG